MLPLFFLSLQVWALRVLVRIRWFLWCGLPFKLIWGWPLHLHLKITTRWLYTVVPGRCRIFLVCSQHANRALPAYRKLTFDSNPNLWRSEINLHNYLRKGWRSRDATCWPNWVILDKNRLFLKILIKYKHHALSPWLMPQGLDGCHRFSRLRVFRTNKII